MMASHLHAIQNFTSGDKIEIEVELAVPPATIWSTRSFRLNNAHSKILALVLAYQHPKDILTGMSIDTDKALAWQNGKEFHHFFPQAFLKAKGVSSSKASALANMVFLSSTSNKAISDQPPSVYLKTLLDSHGESAKQWLASNLVNEDGIFAALEDDYEAFLTARAGAIDTRVKQLAGW